MKKDTKIAKREYEIFKTQWLIDNNYTLDDVIDYLFENYKHQGTDPKSLFKDFEKYGFNYDIYPTFEKWYNEKYGEK